MSNPSRLFRCGPSHPAPSRRAARAALAAVAAPIPAPRRVVGAAAALSLLAAPAMAHTGHADANGFLHGLAHPVLGPDHLAAMMAVGLWSGFVLPDRLWRGAAVFMAAMVAGGLLALAGVALPLVEPGILASVVVFGLILGFAGRGAGAVPVSLGLIAAFAVFHGHAHAAEATGSIAGYFAGFLAATALLHLAGIGLAQGVARLRHGAAVRRLTGIGIAAFGALLLAG